MSISHTEPVSSNVTATSTHPKPSVRKARALARSRRPRNEFDSEDEIEREADQSDATSSHLSFESDDETDDEDEDDKPPLPHANGTSMLPSVSETGLPSPPSSPHSYSRRSEVDTSRKGLNESNPPFSQPVDWSEAVLQSETNELPVLDFAQVTELVSANPSTSYRSEAVKEEHISRSSTRPNVYRPPVRQSARQLYQQRLSEDPSYVPVVGEFWGHDDRLMDKSLRSLSNWWRGRWIGRGRGKALSRRDFASPESNAENSPFPWKNSIRKEGKLSANEGQDERLEQQTEKMWVHDGYEQMKLREERRGTTNFRGGRGFSRGHIAGSGRHTGVEPSGASETRGRASLSGIAHVKAQVAVQGRTWYAQKPERAWTKQFDAFLYSEPPVKSKVTMGQRITIRLPGASELVTYIPPSTKGQILKSTPIATPMSDTDHTYVVKVPGSVVIHPPSRSIAGSDVRIEAITTMEQPPFDGYQNSSNLVISSIPASHPPSDAVISAENIPTQAPPLEEVKLPSVPLNSPLSSSFQDAVPAHASHSQVHNLQASQDLSLQDGQPHYQPPASFGPFYAYQTGLPPGVVLDEGGYPIDINTGHPVFLHTNANPSMAAMYNASLAPHPHMIHSDIHQQYPQLPVDYISSVSYEHLPMEFSLPRQNSQVQIRAPQENGESPHPTHRTSNLRSAVKAEPFQPSLSPYYVEDRNDFDAALRDGDERHPQMQPTSYQGVQYYLPPTYAFGSYMDPNQPYHGFGNSQGYY